MTALTENPQANHLIRESSPYLLQHAHNPVDWYSWGSQAFALARAEDKPILLSIGYSACHWCHVMAHESFEDPGTAELMNRLFVNVKVDREERPDVDAIYMDAVQAMTGRGGWPMTVFLTPEGKPFYGGTYFPPTPRYGMPSFRQVLSAVSEAWQRRRDELQQASDRLTSALATSAAVPADKEALSPGILQAATAGLLENLDRQEGGFGGAPKFPQPMALDFLLQRYRQTGEGATLEAVDLTLKKMLRGGMYDHLGGGFHRYSTDARWLVPHFEKMLYDNAQLAATYLHAWQVTGEVEYRRAVEETLDYVLREMTSPEGGFYSTQDADSEGEEGKYFLWTPAEIEDLLGAEDARLFAAYYAVTPQGNFHDAPGKSILNTPQDAGTVARAMQVEPEQLSQALQRGRRKLLAVRGQRVPPGRDEKVLAEWNGLMIQALAEAGAALDRPDYVAASGRAADFLLQSMCTGNNGELRLYRSYKDGLAHLPGYLEDYAAAGLGLLALYEATFDPSRLKVAAAIAEVMAQLFFDPEAGGFYQTSQEHERLVVRRKDFTDNAVPSGNSLAAELFLHLGRLLERSDYTTYGESIAHAMSGALGSHPLAFGRLLSAAGFLLQPGFEIAVIGEITAADTRALLREVWTSYLPTSVVAACDPRDVDVPAVVPLLRDRPQLGGRPTAYVCQNYACRLPVTEPDALARQLLG